jgi:hypothetical protein
MHTVLWSPGNHRHLLPTIATSEGGHTGFCKKGRKTLSINVVWVQRSCDATKMALNQSARTKDYVPSYTVSAEVISDSNLLPSQALSIKRKLAKNRNDSQNDRNRAFHTVSSACAEATYLYNRSKSIFTHAFASNVRRPQDAQPPRRLKSKQSVKQSTLRTR